MADLEKAFALVRRSNIGWRVSTGLLALATTAIVSAPLTLAGLQLVEIPEDARDAKPDAFAVRGGAPDCGTLTLTQSTNPNVIGNNSVACLDGAVSAENSAARAFVAPSSLTLKCVTFGVRINQGAAWPVDVRILSGDPLSPYDSLTVLSEETVIVAASANREFYTVDIPDVSLTAGAPFIVEIRTPSRRLADGGDGGQLAFGFNELGQSAPTFFRGPFCGAGDFVDLASLGFPNLHLVMSVGYDEGASSLLLDGFHHNAVGGAVFLSDGSSDVLVSGDPMTGPFGFSIPFGDDTRGVQPPLIDWDIVPGTTMSFNYNLANGETDILSFVANPDGSLTLETAFASFIEPVFDVQVFDGDQLVGVFTNQTSGDIMIMPGAPEERNGWTAPCKTRRIILNGIEVLDPDYVVDYRGTMMVWTSDTGPGTTHQGDRFNLGLSTTPGSTGSPPTSVDFLASGMASFAVNRDLADVVPGVRFGDASTSPRLVDGDLVTDVGALVQVTNGDAGIELFGEATMAAGGPRIRVRPGGLGSTGKDGVRVSFGGVDSASVELGWVFPDPPPAFMTLDATQLGGGSGGSVTIDPCMGCPPPIIDDWWNLRPDFSAVGSGTYTLQVVHNGMVVHEQSGLSGLAGISSGRPWKGGKLGGATPCWRMCYPTDTPFIIASTAQQVLMDEVRILAENAGPLEYLDFIEIRAGNMEEFGLLNPQTVLPPPPQPCLGDTNGDNVVNFSDLNAALAQFGQSGPGLSADVNNDGIVDFGDLNVILSNFGLSCP